MRRLALLGLLLAALALFAANTGSGAAPRPATTAGLISAIKGKVCGLLDGVETVELPLSLANFVRSGELEASTVILFGTNKLLCGGGHVEKVLSLAHDWLLGAVAQPNLKLPGFDTFRSELPSLVRSLRGVGPFQMSGASLPTATFSKNPVGADNLVPMTVKWLAAPFVSSVILEADPLSSAARPFSWQVSQTGLVGTQTAPLDLSSGRWQLCIRPVTVFKSDRACGYPFWITICSSKARFVNSQLARGTTARLGFYGSQVGVVGNSAYGTATFDVDRILSTYFKVTFNVRGLFGSTERFFAYWAWNLGEGWHALDVYAPTGPFGSPIAGHILDVVMISSVLVQQC